jgi:hypothetical protein
VNGRVEAFVGRAPYPPPGLAQRLRDDGDHGEGAPHRTLASAARTSLDRARARPGRVRESAFTLLEADALLTYACEAALDAENPEAAILDILAAASS